MITTTRERTFEPTPRSVRAARVFAVRASALPDDAEPTQRLALVASELATNALVHAGTEFTVRVVSSGDTLRVAVHDDGPGAPTTPTPRAEPERSGGHGLVIVDALATSWGVDPDPAGRGKWVWADLEAPLGG